MKIIVIKTDNTYQVKDVEDISKVLDGCIKTVRPTAAYVDKLLLRDNLFVCDKEGD